MKRCFVLGSLLFALVLVILLAVGPVRAQLAPESQGRQPTLVSPINDLSELLNYPYDVQVEDLTDPERQQVVTKLLAKPEAIQLQMAMAEKGFAPSHADSEAMRLTVQMEDGTIRTIEVAVVPMGAAHRIFLPLIVKNHAGSTALARPVEPGDERTLTVSPGELSAYLVAMVADDDTSFFQAHHTNLDPRLADVPDPAIIVNGMPYFYITTLRIVDGRIVYWRYWWFDSNHHPNWYYACYQHYWDYFSRAGAPWPPWHHWVYGWYYWRFWYFWSTWFPYAVPAGG